MPISGQDATADGCNSIVKGELTVSILKDIRNLSPLAVNLTDNLLKGQTNADLKQYTMAELTNDPAKTGNVMALFLPVQQVNKDNVDELVVKSGFQKAEDVYRDVQAPAAGGEKIKVGLSFSDFATERWKNEQELMEKLLKEKGYDVVWQEAAHDVKAQNDQILYEQLEKIKQVGEQGRIFDVAPMVNELEAKIIEKRKEIYENLTPWQRVQLSRHRGTSLYPVLYKGNVRGVCRIAWRQVLWRRQGHCCRACENRWPNRDDYRPIERHEYPHPPIQELWHGKSGRLQEGTAPYETCRAVSVPGCHFN